MEALRERVGCLEEQVTNERAAKEGLREMAESLRKQVRALEEAARADRAREQERTSECARKLHSTQLELSVAREERDGARAEVGEWQLRVERVEREWKEREQGEREKAMVREASRREEVEELRGELMKEREEWGRERATLEAQQQQEREAGVEKMRRKVEEVLCECERAKNEVSAGAAKEIDRERAQLRESEAVRDKEATLRARAEEDAARLAEELAEVRALAQSQEERWLAAIAEGGVDQDGGRALREEVAALRAEVEEKEGKARAAGREEGRREVQEHVEQLRRQLKVMESKEQETPDQPRAACATCSGRQDSTGAEAPDEAGWAGERWGGEGIGGERGIVCSDGDSITPRDASRSGAGEEAGEGDATAGGRETRRKLALSQALSRSTSHEALSSPLKLEPGEAVPEEMVVQGAEAGTGNTGAEAAAAARVDDLASLSHLGQVFVGGFHPTRRCVLPALAPPPLLRAARYSAPSFRASFPALARCHGLTPAGAGFSGAPRTGVARDAAPHVQRGGVPAQGRWWVCPSCARTCLSSSEQQHKGVAAGRHTAPLTNTTNT